MFKKLGVKIKKKKKGNYKIYGKGLGSLYAKKNTKIKFWKFWNFSKTINWHTFNNTKYSI